MSSSSILYAAGSDAALEKLGVERPRRLSGSERDVIGDGAMDDDARSALYSDYVTDVAKHPVAGMGQYQEEGKQTGGTVGGGIGTLLGAAGGASLGGGRGAMLGAPLGLAAGYFGGGALGKAVGGAHHNEDRRRQDDAQHMVQNADARQRQMMIEAQKRKQQLRAQEEAGRDRRHQEMMYSQRPTWLSGERGS